MDLTLIGCLIAICFIMYTMYQGYSPILMSLVAGVIICIFAGKNVDLTMASDFAGGFGNMVKTVCLYFIASTIFGQVMMKTKMAYSIAYWIADKIGPKHAPAAIFTIAAVLMYGGMGFANYVICYPIGLVLCSKSNNSKGIIQGCVVGGAWTFVMTGPFAPTNHNSISMSILGTTPSAGLIPGLAGSLFMIITIVVYLEWQAKRWQKKGKVFNSWDEIPEDNAEERATFPNPFVSLIPIIVTIVLFNVVKWKIGTCICCGALSAMLLRFKACTPKEWLMTCWNDGAKAGILPMANLAIMAGIGGIISTTTFYSTLTNLILNSPIHPYILAATAGNLMGFALGSASSALATVLPALAPIYTVLVAERGLDMGNFHRLTAVGAGGLSQLPHNATIVSLNSIYKTTHKESYFPVFITSALIPIIAVYAVEVPLAMLGFK